MIKLEKNRPHPQLVKLERLTDLADGFQLNDPGPILMVADDRTYAAAGREACRILQGVGYAIRECVLLRPAPLTPDETALAEIRAACTEDLRYFLAVGSGSINDLMKQVSDEKGIPLVTLATAASMDGYTSSVAVLTLDGYKVTKKATPPMMVLSIAEVLDQAPAEMGAAGIGDLLGKYTSLADWRLGRFINDEPYSEELVRKLRDAVASATGSRNGDSRNESVQRIMTALVLSGEVMLTWGDSRPASGAEHHLSHFWEMEAGRFGYPDHLHGHKVGVATVLITDLYHRIFTLDKRDVKTLMAHRVPETEERFVKRVEEAYGELAGPVAKGLNGLYLDEARRRERQQQIINRWDEMKSWVMENLPSSQTIEAMLRNCGAPVVPADLDIDEALVIKALQNAKEMRSRYTILRLAEDIGYRPA